VHSHVRFGSLADICGAKRHVRFTPKAKSRAVWRGGATAGAVRFTLNVAHHLILPLPIRRSVKSGSHAVDDRDHVLPEPHARDGDLARLLDPVSGNHVVSEVGGVVVVAISSSGRHRPAPRQLASGRD
jgi:hypothetical protein